MTKSEIHLREKVCYRAEDWPTDYFGNAFNLIKVKLKMFNSSFLCSHVKTKN